MRPAKPFGESQEARFRENVRRKSNVNILATLPVVDTTFAPLETKQLLNRDVRLCGDAVVPSTVVTHVCLPVPGPASSCVELVGAPQVYGGNQRGRMLREDQE